jgi:hypothetical protein
MSVQERAGFYRGDDFFAIGGRFSSEGPSTMTRHMFCCRNNAPELAVFSQLRFDIFITCWTSGNSPAEGVAQH